MDNARVENKKIRVAFIIGNIGWNGGINYFTNIIRAIEQYAEVIAPIVYISKASNLHKKFPIHFLKETNLLNTKTIVGVISGITDRYFFGYNYLFYKKLKEDNIDVLSHFGNLYRYGDIKTIFWMPDLQHKFLIENFSKKEIRKREKSIKYNVQNCQGILLSSETERKKFLKIYQTDDKKTFKLNFVPQSFAPNQIINKKTLIKKYKLADAWIHIPNQFWKHKNHLNLLEAISKITLPTQPQFVFTGELKDYRNKDYIHAIRKKMVESEVRPKIKILESIPLEHVHSIMFHAIAIINPSFYEGWSTTVEEAKNYGKRILLSNIEVHKEQNPNRCQFFDPFSVENIKDNLEILISNSQEYEIEMDIEDIERRRKEMVKNYENIILKIVKL